MFISAKINILPKSKVSEKNLLCQRILLARFTVLIRPFVAEICEVQDIAKYSIRIYFTSRFHRWPNRLNTNFCCREKYTLFLLLQALEKYFHQRKYLQSKLKVFDKTQLTRGLHRGVNCLLTTFCY